MRPSSNWISGAFHVGLWSLVRLGFGWAPATEEPVEIELVVWNPFLDRLPGRFDRLHAVEVKGWRWWAWKLNVAVPQAVEAEKGFWRAEVLREGQLREPRQLEQWADAIKWYLACLDACVEAGSDHRSLSEVAELIDD
jgi:hypothetical protein